MQIIHFQQSKVHLIQGQIVALKCIYITGTDKN